MSASKLGQLLKENGLKGIHSKDIKRHYLDTGYPPLNEKVTGNHMTGLPSGQLVMIAGPSACGKTVTATELMISAQRQGGFAGLFDYERQYHLGLAESQGLDTENEDKFARYKPDTFEEGISDAINLGKLIRTNNIIPEDAPIVFVFDSIHAMTAKSKFLSLMAKKGAIETGDKLSMHDNYALAKCFADWSAIIQSQFDKYGITGIFLNQVRIEKDQYENITYKFPGGDTFYFYCSTVLILTAKDIMEGKGDDKDLIHKDIRCLVKKSRNNKPLQVVRWNFAFDKAGNGKIDVITSYTNYLLDIGAIETSGAWIKFMGKSIQGRDKVVDYFQAEPDGVEQLKKIHSEFKAKGKVEAPSEAA